MPSKKDRVWCLDGSKHDWLHRPSTLAPIPNGDGAHDGDPFREYEMVRGGRGHDDPVMAWDEARFTKGCASHFVARALPHIQPRDMCQHCGKCPHCGR